MAYDEPYLVDDIRRYIRELAERTGNDLDESGRNGPGWVS